MKESKGTEHYDFVNESGKSFLRLMENRWIKWFWIVFIHVMAIIGLVLVNKILKGELIKLEYDGICPRCKYEQVYKIK